MSYIKKFIDQVSFLESRPGKDLIMSSNDARMLRDEICKLLIDKTVNKSVSNSQNTIMINGGSFK